MTILAELRAEKRKLEDALRRIDLAIAAFTSDTPKAIHRKTIKMVCLNCEKSFMAGRRDAKFHSKSCRDEYMRKGNGLVSPSRSHKKGVVLIPGAQK